MKNLDHLVTTNSDDNFAGQFVCVVYFASHHRITSDAVVKEFSEMSYAQNENFSL